jgi:N-methylhydantoinase A
VRRADVLEIDERIDYAGSEIIALDSDQVRAAARELVDGHGCDALAVCFLWSFINPAHEREAKQAIAELYPELFVSISCEVFPVAREYERLVTTVFNSFTSAGVAEYVSTLEGKLTELGCAARPSLMQSVGGLLSPEEARGLPIQLISSGPVGGVVGARALAERLDLHDVITADMGGTSFDCALIKDLTLTEAHRADLGKFATGLSMIDISAIVAGGGSIFWRDARRAPRAGPHSAGADPGPACYGRGGTEPTVTDVALAMGLMDPDYFLGGAMALDRDAALRAVRERIAEPMGWGIDRALPGLYRIVVDAMSNAVRAISIERGHDPRDFTMVGYGGASGLFLPLICRAMGISDLVLPANASVFSAYGLLFSARRALAGADRQLDRPRLAACAPQRGARRARRPGTRGHARAGLRRGGDRDRLRGRLQVRRAGVRDDDPPARRRALRGAPWADDRRLHRDLRGAQRPGHRLGGLPRAAAHVGERVEVPEDARAV